MWMAVTREVSRALRNCQLSRVPREAIGVARASAQHRDYRRVLETPGCRVLTLPEPVFVRTPRSCWNKSRY